MGQLLGKEREMLKKDGKRSIFKGKCPPRKVKEYGTAPDPQYKKK